MEIEVNPRRVSVTIICVPSWDSKHLPTQQMAEILLLEPVFLVRPHSLWLLSPHFQNSRALDFACQMKAPHITPQLLNIQLNITLPRNPTTTKLFLLSPLPTKLRFCFSFLYECSKYPAIKWWLCFVPLKLNVEGPKVSSLTHKSRAKWNMLRGIYSAIYGEVNVSVSDGYVLHID